MADYTYTQHLKIIDQANQVEGRKIDLGGQFSCPQGFESVDLQGGDIIADLRERYPFDNNSIAVVRAFDFMEHVADKMHTLSEIHRILMPGGILISMTPSTVGPDGLAGMGADQDPTHISFWCRNAFWYVTDERLMQYIGNTKIKFEPMVMENCYPSRWHVENRIPYVIFDAKKVVA